MVTIEGQPWFLPRDIAVVLGLRESPAGGYAHHLQRSIGQDEKRSISRKDIPNSELWLSRNAAFASVISESGLYKLIMRSDKPQARDFQDWVAREALPSIRKTGAYVTGQPSIVENPKMDPLSLLMAQARFTRRMHKGATATRQATEETPQRQAPGALHFVGRAGMSTLA